MAYIEAIEVVIGMINPEAAEHLPSFAGKKKKQILESIKLKVDHKTLKNFGYTHYRIIKAGEKSDTMIIGDGTLEGYPTLKVRLYSYPDWNNVSAKPFGDDKSKICACFKYSVEAEGKDPFYFDDRCGCTDISRVTAEMKSPEFFDQKIRQKAVEL